MLYVKLDRLGWRVFCGTIVVATNSNLPLALLSAKKWTKHPACYPTCPV